MSLLGKSSLVVGGGVVGLATARKLAQLGSSVVLAEKEVGVGRGTSGRNSQVVHGGMYYPSGSLKAQCCVRGRRMLYDLCDRRGVEYLVREKLIVATSEDQVPALRKIYAQAAANGLDEKHKDALQWIDGREAKRMEPELECVMALRSPKTGVVDAAAFMLALQAELEDMGGVVALGTEVAAVKVNEHENRFLVWTKDGSESEFDILVNCAGLYAIEFAGKITSAGKANNNWQIPRARFAKGNYFQLEGVPSPFQRLIYPIPEAAGLGVHVTLDIGGAARFGPDVEWINVNSPDDIDYTVNPRRADSFYAEIRKYWPGLPDNALSPDYSGVRPKVSMEGFQDFALYGPKQHGVLNLVHAIGIESPGLTSSLALADLIGDLINETN